MKLVRAFGLFCCLSAAPATAQTVVPATCAGFLAANPQRRAQFVFMSGQWTAGFVQAKLLSCAGASNLPAGAEQERHRTAECRFRDASRRFLDMPAAEKERRLIDICQRFPDNDMTMNTMLIFFDINAATQGN